MAIKLLGHVFWNTGMATAADARRGSDWVVELREPSRWNPVAAREAVPAGPADAAPTEPVWAETQPCWHD